MHWTSWALAYTFGRCDTRGAFECMANQSNSADLAARSVIGSPLENLARTLAFMVVLFALSTMGFIAAGWSASDAAYMVILTIFSVGYEEVQPVNTPWLRALDMATIVLGCTGMIVLTGALVQVFAHYQLRNLLGLDRMKMQIDKLSGHAIICGFGRIGRQLAKELVDAGQSFVVLERDPAKCAEAESMGFLYHVGDATDEDALKAVGVTNARVLATVLPNDAANVFITLSARNLNPRLEIIARGEVPTTEGKLIHAGADKVVLPTHIGAERIAEMILYPSSARFLDDAPQMAELKRSLHKLGLDLEAVTVPESSELVGESVGLAERRANGAFLIVQIDRANGQSFVHPPYDMAIETDDTVVLILRNDRVAAGSIFAKTKQPERVGRGFVTKG